jgi:predicted nucleic acid-binding protein
MIERVADFRDLLLSIIPEDSQLMVSDLTKLECRVKPIKDKNMLLLEDYDLFFNESAIILSLSSEVIEKATEIRANYNFNTPDSIHLACATISKAEFFITNDKRLNSFKDVKVKILGSSD